MNKYVVSSFCKDHYRLLRCLFYGGSNYTGFALAFNNIFNLFNHQTYPPPPDLSFALKRPII